jgi:molecular chaperone DnaJ
MDSDVSLDKSNLYDVLGIAPDADVHEVRRAFRALARILHPDVNAAEDAPRKFALVAGAHAVLSDPDRRRAYDALRQAASAASVRYPNGFPVGAVRRGALRGADVEIGVTLSLREAAFGAHIQVDVPRREVCALCLGRGVAEGVIGERCPSCNGSGGSRERGGECSSCGGSGVAGTPRCANCGGAGRKSGMTPLTVSMLAGVEDCAVVMFKGDGDVGPCNGPRGDLLVHVAVKRDPVLRRSGIDILMELPVSACEAQAGCSIEIPTLRGPKKLRLPAHTPDRTLLRVPGAGIRLHGTLHRGDQFVTVHVNEIMPKRPAD